MSRQPGASLTEYGLALAIVAVGAVLALMLLGGNLDDLLTRTGNSLANVQTAATAGTISDTDPNDTGTDPGGETTRTWPNGYVMRHESVCFEDGGCLAIPVIDSSTVANTTGGMGGELTHELAGVFEAMARQLAAQGGDPQVVNLITALAQQGHTLGDQQLQVLTDCPINTGAACTVYRITDTIQAVEAQDARFNERYQALKNYLDANPHSIPDSWQRVIALQTANINAIADSYTPSNFIYRTVNDNSGDTWDFLERPQVTHQSANTICASGGDRPRCIR